jgi:hypothetical protein
MKPACLRKNLNHRSLLRIILLVLGGTASTAMAQLPPWSMPGSPQPAMPTYFLERMRPRSLKATIEIRPVAIVPQAKENWKKGWGTFKNDFLRMKHVEVRTTPWGVNPVKAVVEIVWFGREVVPDGLGRRVILKWDRKDISIPAGEGVKSTLLHSGLIAERVTDHLGIGSKSGSSLKVEGWYLRVVANNEIVQEATTHKHLAEIARDENKLAAVLDCSALNH